MHFEYSIYKPPSPLGHSVSNIIDIFRLGREVIIKIKKTEKGELSSSKLKGGRGKASCVLFRVASSRNWSFFRSYETLSLMWQETCGLYGKSVFCILRPLLPTNSFPLARRTLDRTTWKGLEGWVKRFDSFSRDTGLFARYRYWTTERISEGNCRAPAVNCWTYCT